MKIGVNIGYWSPPGPPLQAAEVRRVPRQRRDGRREVQARRPPEPPGAGGGSATQRQPERGHLHQRVAGPPGGGDVSEGGDGGGREEHRRDQANEQEELRDREGEPADGHLVHQDVCSRSVRASGVIGVALATLGLLCRRRTE